MIIFITVALVAIALAIAYRKGLIRVAILNPRRISAKWDSDTRILLMGFYWVTVGVDFGITGSAWFKHFYRMCPVCHKPLNPNDRGQVIYFHGPCRTEGRRMERRKLKLSQKIA